MQDRVHWRLPFSSQRAKRSSYYGTKKAGGSPYGPEPLQGARAAQRAEIAELRVEFYAITFLSFRPTAQNHENESMRRVPREELEHLRGAGGHCGGRGGAARKPTQSQDIR